MSMMPSAYDNETYLTGLAASQADAKRQVENALGEVERRKQLAMTQLAQAGGEQTRAFDGAQGDYRGAIGGMKQNLGRFGGLFGGLSAYDTSAFEGAQGTMRQGFSESNGLLGQGFDEQAKQRAAMASRIGADVEADYGRQRTDYISRREAEDRAAEEARRQAEIQRQHEIDMQNAQLAAMGGGGGGGTDWASLLSLLGGEESYSQDQGIPFNPTSGAFPAGWTPPKKSNVPSRSPAAKATSKIFGGKGKAPASPPGLDIASLLRNNPTRDSLSQAIGVAPQQLMQLEDGSWAVQTPNGYQSIESTIQPGIGVRR